MEKVLLSCKRTRFFNVESFRAIISNSFPRYYTTSLAVQGQILEFVNPNKLIIRIQSGFCAYSTSALFKITNDVNETLWSLCWSTDEVFFLWILLNGEKRFIEWLGATSTLRRTSDILAKALIMLHFEPIESSVSCHHPHLLHLEKFYMKFWLNILMR